MPFKDALCKVIYDFTSTDDSIELSVRKDQDVIGLGEPQDNWLLVQLANNPAKKGFVPSDYVKVVTPNFVQQSKSVERKPQPQPPMTKSPRLPFNTGPAFPDDTNLFPPPINMGGGAGSSEDLFASAPGAGFGGGGGAVSSAPPPRSMMSDPFSSGGPPPLGGGNAGGGEEPMFPSSGMFVASLNAARGGGGGPPPIPDQPLFNAFSDSGPLQSGPPAISVGFGAPGPSEPSLFPPQPMMDGGAGGTSLFPSQPGSGFGGPVPAFGANPAFGAPNPAFGGDSGFGAPNFGGGGGDAGFGAAAGGGFGGPPVPPPEIVKVLPPLEAFAQTEAFFKELLRERREALTKVDSQISATTSSITQLKDKNALVSQKIHELMAQAENERTKWRERVEEERRILMNRPK